MRVTVFGATGFLGRYVVNRLGRVGSTVFVPYRGEESAWKHLKVMGDLGQIIALKTDFRDAASLDQAVARATVVVNLIGTERPTRNWSLEAVNGSLAGAVAQAVARRGLRLVHVSDVWAGLPPGPSVYVRSRAAGEAAVRHALPDATILRLADVWGCEDRFLNRLGMLNRRWPLVPSIGSLRRRVQPVWVSDVATAIVYALKHEETGGSTYELGGPEVYAMEEIFRLVHELTLINTRIVTPPTPLAGPLFRLLQLSRTKFFSADQVHSHQLDRVAAGSGLAALGVPVPERLETRAYDILRAYRRPQFVNMVDVHTAHRVTDKFFPGDQP